MEPEVNQYGRNMVMTNVKRTGKRKYVNIDSFYKDITYNETNSLANINITLPERITNTHSIMVCNAEIPMSFYNISAALGNNYFSINNGVTTTVYFIDDGFYSPSSLITAINNAIVGTGVSFTHNSLNNRVKISSTGTTFVNFNIDNGGSGDEINYKSKLGWALGFRSTSPYTITSPTTITSEKATSLNMRYIYIVVDEFSSANTNSFISPNGAGFISKNILARITLDYPFFQFGQVLPANNFNGLLLTDVRSYNGAIDIQKLNIQLVGDTGTVLDLNGSDFSFCLQVDYE
jgi:hypothetical protein